MAAYSEMLPATGAQENEEKRGEEDLRKTTTTLCPHVDFWQTGGGILKDWLIRPAPSWKLLFSLPVMSQQTPTRCTLYLHQKSPPPGRFYNQFANLKRNFLIDFSIQKLSVRNEDFHLNPSLGVVKLFRKFIKYSSKWNLSISLPALRLQARWSIKCCKPLTPTSTLLANPSENSHPHYWQIHAKSLAEFHNRIHYTCWEYWKQTERRSSLANRR